MGHLQCYTSQMCNFHFGEFLETGRSFYSLVVCAAATATLHRMRRGQTWHLQPSSNAYQISSEEDHLQNGSPCNLMATVCWPVLSRESAHSKAVPMAQAVLSHPGWPAAADNIQISDVFGDEGKAHSVPLSFQP